MRKFVIVFLLSAALAAPPLSLTHAQRASGQATATSTTAPASSSPRPAADQITAEQLSAYLHFIAADELEGRDTPSRGLDIAANFIRYNLTRWGYKPAGDNGTFFQRIALRRDQLDAAQTRAEVGGQRFKLGEDFIASPTPGSAAGPLVFVGHGWMIKSKNIDAFQGVEVKDKIVVIQGGEGLPKGVSFAELRGGKPGVDWADPMTYAHSRGAKGVVSVPNSRMLSNWEQRSQRTLARGSLKVEKLQEEELPTRLPAISLSAKMTDALFRGEKHNAAAILGGGDQVVAPFDFAADKKVSFTIAAKPEELDTQNVVAILEGSDPVLKNEYVALGCHYDHVGSGTPVNGDAIYNGADDDGSGTVALMAMAEALAREPRRPKRSILFVWHAGEEKGLWGSEYFTKYPTVPLNQIVVQLNIDMIGRSRRDGDADQRNRSLTGPNEIYVIGSKMMSTDLGELSERVNRNYLNLSFNYKYDDPKDPSRFFFRSDHYNYARNGIPVIFYFDGEHEDYHRPGDHPDKIDYRKMEKVTRTIYMTMWELADAAARPRVDKRLPAELTEERN